MKAEIEIEIVDDARFFRQFIGSCEINGERANLSMRFSADALVITRAGKPTIQIDLAALMEGCIRAGSGGPTC